MAAVADDRRAHVFDDAVALAEFIGERRQNPSPLLIRGGGSKAFYGNPPGGGEEILSLSALTGVVAYEPGELYITARAGTPLDEIDRLLAENNQFLPFDPPQFDGGATFGGAIAAGLAGPGKPRFGGVRDAMLGVRIINGDGELLQFGGQVMKNVAGYDISRLMAGALGTLAIIVEASVKVMPRPQAVATVAQTLPPAAAVAAVGGYIRRSLPVAASFYAGGRLFLRLAAARDIEWAVAEIGGDGDVIDDGAFWRDIRDQRHSFFAAGNEGNLWRVSVAATEKAATAFSDLLLAGAAAGEYNGAVYWRRDGDAVQIRRQAEELGGYACLFRRRAGETTSFLPPPPPPLAQLQRRLKESFDVRGIFNPGRLF